MTDDATNTAAATQPKSHVLIIDDDTRLRRLLNRYLTDNGFVVSEAADADEARQLMANIAFDMLVLDVMMPHENGYIFAKSLRDKGNMIPILMLTAMGQLQDRIQGLESGVDDYLAKPFDPKELLLRMHSILRRINTLKDNEDVVVHFGETLYHTERAELEQGGTFLPLTAVEADLMRVLTQKAGQEVTRAELAAVLDTTNERTVDVQVNRLRKKLESDPKSPRYLQTVRGKGYVLIPD